MNIKKISMFEMLTILIAFVAFIVSIRACSLSENANQISLDSNAISRQANSIALEVNSFQMTAQSLSILREKYDQIYSDDMNRLVLNKIINNEIVVDDHNLTNFVDIFEDVGDMFCSGIVYRVNIRTQLSTALKDVCGNSQIYNEFSGRRNGVAMLCSEFFPESLFASTIKCENVPTCDFLDFDNRLSSFCGG